MEVHKVEVSSLVFDPVNARKHDSRNLEAIKGSLTRFGQQKPIVVDAKGVVLAGNGTLAAAKALGWTEIWVKQSDLDTVNASAYSLADNRTAELAEWDDEALHSQLAALDLAGFDVAMLSFDLPNQDEVFKEITGSKELSEDEFSEFDHKCPKCGFEFDKA